VYLELLPINEVGRDFVIGDLHGMFDVLMRAMDDHGFDPATDRVFSVGDLVDRGPDSIKCIRLVKEDWFKAVRGNHEQSIISLGKSFMDKPNKKIIQHLLKGGGDWVFNGNELSPEFFEALPLMEGLPLAIQVGDASHGFGVIHADFLGLESWGALVDWFSLHERGDREYRYLNRHSFDDDSRDPVFHHLLCGRTTPKKLIRNILDPESVRIRGIPLVYFGHTVMDRPMQFANRVYLDICAHEYGELSFFQAHPNTEVCGKSHAA
jgi:serine/threonine protein phosphatase 1